MLARPLMKHLRPISPWHQLLLDPHLQGAIPYLIRDEFTTPRAAGAVNGTPAEPGPGGPRVALDTTSKLSLTGGTASFSGGNSTWGDPGLWVPPIVSRLPGRLLIAEHTRPFITGHTAAGFKATADAGTFTEYIQAASGGKFYASKPAGAIAVKSFTAGQWYLCIALRAAGALFFLKPAAAGTWKLIYPGTTGTTAAMYAGMSAYNDQFTSDLLHLPSRLYLPPPIASDGMSALAATDGLGHAEGVAGTVGAGGDAAPWTSTLGTWQVAAGVASASALDGGAAIRTLQSSTPDVFVECDLTRSSGNLGLVLRYVDSSNYVYLYHDGVNVTLRKVIAGVDTQVLAPTAAAYGAGRILSVSADGTLFRVFYHDLAIGAEQTIADAAVQDGLGVGLYTTDTGNTFDDLVVRPIGTGDEYAWIDAYTLLGAEYDAASFGDSIVMGTAATSTAGRWSNIVADAMGWNLHPAGISGTILQNTVQNAIAVIGGAAVNNGRDTYADRLLAYTPNYVLLLYGLNDVRLNDVAITAAAFQNDLTELVTALIAAGIHADRIVIGSPPYMNPAFYAGAPPWNGGSTPRHVTFVAAAAAAAAATGTRYIDVYQWMLDHGDLALISADGIHPNDAGHAQIAAAFLSVL